MNSQHQTENNEPSSLLSGATIEPVRVAPSADLNPAPAGSDQITSTPAAIIRTTKLLPQAPVEMPPAEVDRGFSSGSRPSLLPVITDAIPRYRENPRPVYPDVARRRGWTGEVLLRVWVDATGRVDRISLKRSSGYPALDREARRTVRRWRFVPAQKKLRKVASDVVVPIHFHLTGTLDVAARVQQ